MYVFLFPLNSRTLDDSKTHRYVYPMVSAHIAYFILTDILEISLRCLEDIGKSCGRLGCLLEVYAVDSSSRDFQQEELLRYVLSSYDRSSIRIGQRVN